MSKEILVVGTKMKDAIKDLGCQSAADLIDAVSEEMHKLLVKAAARAKANGRATVRPCDL